MRVLMLFLLLLSAVLMALSLSDDFSEWYAARVFPVLAGTLGRLLALLPVSLFELLLPMALLWLLLFALYILLMQSRPARRRKLRRTLPYDLARLGAGLAACLLLFVLTSGLLHNRQSFAEKNGLAAEPVGREELLQLAALLGRQAEAAEQLPAAPRSKPGNQAGQAMQALSQTMEGLLNRYPRARASLYLHKLQPAALLAPVTAEALYPRDLTAEVAPVEACRALARLSGYRREGEDSLIAILACLNAEDASVQISGLSAAATAVLAELERHCSAAEFDYLLQELPASLRAAWQSWRALSPASQRVGGDVVQLLAAYYRGQQALQAFAPLDTGPPPVLPVVELDGSVLHSPHITVVDLDTGEQIYGRGEHLRAHPASLTKILTASVAIDLIDNPDAMLTVTNQDQLGLFEQGASMSGFSIGERVSYRDLLYTLMLISGCDSGNALAYHLTGSLEAFVEQMNDRAASLGLTNSSFANPSGLTDDNQLTTAADLAVILADALEQPLFREIFCARRYQVPPTDIQPEGMAVVDLIFQRLERDHGGAMRPNGAVIQGGKTGYTRAAGLCLAVLVEFQGRELLVVTMGGGLPTQDNEQYNYYDVLALVDALREGSEQ